MPYGSSGMLHYRTEAEVHEVYQCHFFDRLDPFRGHTKRAVWSRPHQCKVSADTVSQT